jgi:hypothetical protein
MQMNESICGKKFALIRLKVILGRARLNELLATRSRRTDATTSAKRKETK